MENKIRISFSSVSVNEGFSRMAIAAAAMPLDPNLEELTDLKTAVSEAVTNAIVHGYKDSIGTVYIEIKVSGTTISVTVRDKGCGIPDITKAKEPLFTTGAAEERAGLGFTLMETFTDKMRVRSVVGRGTTVLLEKRIRGKI